MRGALLPVLLAAAVAVPAQGQTDRPAPAADTVAAPAARAAAPSEIPPPARRATTLALPNGRGVFYYRAGEPGGVRIRSRAGQRPAAPAAAAPQGLTRDMVREALRPLLDEFVAARAPRAGAAPSGGVSELDLVLLEQNLLRALDRRLAGLDGGRDRTTYLPSSDPPTVVVVPSQAAPVTPAPVSPPESEPVPVPQAPMPPPPTPAVDPLPREPVDPIVAEVERAILDTGLLVTNRVTFEFGEATLIPVSERLLRTIGDVLRQYPEVRLRIGGHTDSISSEAFNLRLSLARANAVRDFLVGYGIDADRLEAVGYGESEPIATNETETGRALNRRVEFTVLNPGDAERRPIRATPDQSEADLRRIIREELERLRDDG